MTQANSKSFDYKIKLLGNPAVAAGVVVGVGVPVVALSKEHNKDFIDQQNKGFQRSIYWTEYKTKEQNEDADNNVFKYINLDLSFQGVNRLFVMACSRVDGRPNRNSRQKYYLPRVDLK